MRYYNIQAGASSWNSDGDPNALNVEMDINVAPGHLPVGNSWLRIWGVDYQTLANANQFNKKNIDVTVGMAKGLPLANPSQQGKIIHGGILPAFSNWVGTDMTLEFVLQAPLQGDGTPDAPHNPAPIVHNWMKGQPLSTAIQKTIQAAFPNFTPVINISPKLMLNYTDTGFYRTIESYSKYIHAISRSIMGKSGYIGVHMAVSGDSKIVVTDNTQQSSGAKNITFNDLVGQPTWLGFNLISVKCVMRGDIQVGDTVTLPKTLTTTAASGGSQFRNSSTIQGTFFVRNVRCIGNFRQPDGNAWVTVLECVSTSNTDGGS